MSHVALASLFLVLAIAHQAPQAPSPQNPSAAPVPPEDGAGSPAPPAFAPGIGADASNADRLGDAPRVVRVSGGVIAGLLVHKVFPENVCKLQAGERTSGAVVLAVRIGKDGRVRNLSGVSGSPSVQRAWMGAVKQWTYRPYLLNGQPVLVDTTVSVSTDCATG